MSQLYELISAGTVPVDVEEAKCHLRITHDAEDDFLLLLLNAATEAAEKYTGRELRANTWTLTIDEFEARICIRRDPVASITSITHLVDDSAEAVATTVYYLKRGPISSEILLQEDQTWPTDTDEREAAIVVTFVTQAHRCTNLAKLAILRAVAFAFENRGDCDPADSEHWLVASGAAKMLDQFRIPRC